MVYVDAAATGAADGSSWANAYTDLQVALAAAPAGTQIFVAQGLYTPDSGTKDKSLSFQLRSGVQLFGGFAGGGASILGRDPRSHETILSGDLNGDDDPISFWMGQKISDNARRVVTATDVDGSAVLDGFTITGGWAKGFDECSQESTGGLSVSNSDLLVRRCVLRVNRSIEGGGCYVGESSEARFERCDFLDNEALDDGGAVNICDSQPVFVDCLFEANRSGDSAGAVMGRNGASLTFRSCRFTANSTDWSGGAIHLWGPSGATIESCSFLGNQSATGGGIGAFAVNFEESVQLNVRDSVFSGNIAGQTWGGAIRAWTTKALIERCTIVENESVLKAAGILIDGLSPEFEIRDSIIWHNRSDDASGETAQVFSGSSAFFGFDIHHCCIEGWSGSIEGPANFSGDPAFVDLDGEDDLLGTSDDDVRIQQASPCVDAASSTEGLAGVDLLGMPRLLDGDLDGEMRCDVGAAEYSNVRLVVDGPGSDDGVVSVDVQAGTPLWGFLIVGFQDSGTLVPPLGALLIDPHAGLARVTLGPLPFHAAFTTSATPIGPRRLLLQAVGFLPAMGVGNFSNAEWVYLD